MCKNKLHNIKSTGFKTPSQYFESFDDKLFECLNEKDMLPEIETSGYTVPQNYFDAVEAQILNKLNQEDKPVIKLNSRTVLYYALSMAASLVILFGLFFNNKDVVSIDAIDTLALESYLYQEDYTNDELASLFKSNDISETNFIDLTISDEMLNQYLENIDTEDLILD